jgi:protein-disulfide isomerase
MIQLMKKTLCLAAAAAFLACSTVPAQQAGPGGDVAARVGDRVISTRELDERWRGQDPSEHAQAMQKVYEGRRGALDALVAELLIAEAAKAKGMGAEAYEKAEIERRSTPVTEADVVSFYQANTSQMQGRSLDAMAPAIRQFLQSQMRTGARNALVAELRKTGPAVQVLIDAPRRQVDIAPTDPSIGNPAAPVTLVEFSDFQCPFCQRVAPTLKQVRATYGDKVRVVWKDFPLTQIHPQAFKAGEAAHCAADQGKYWEYHDRLFANQQTLQVDDLKAHAATLGLDPAKFDACLDSSRYGDRVRSGVAQGNRLGVNSTPTIYINGRLVAGAQPYEVIAAVIDEELSRAAGQK